MAADERFESRLAATLHDLLNAEPLPHPRFADAPVAERIDADMGRPDRTYRPTLLLAAAALIVAVIGGTALAGGRLPEFLSMAVGPDPSPSLVESPNRTISTPSPSASPSPTSSASSSPAPSPTASPGSRPSAPAGFSCDWPVALSRTTTPPPLASVSGVRLGTHSGYDRIVFDLEGTGRPGVTVRQVQPPFVMDASGQTVSVAGDAYLRITLTDAEGHALPSAQLDQRPGYPALVELRNVGDFEGVQSWIAGLRAPACVRVTTLADPTRLVVDLQQP
jgi:hypothetical protein